MQCHYIFPREIDYLSHMLAAEVKLVKTEQFISERMFIGTRISLMLLH